MSSATPIWISLPEAVCAGKVALWRWDLTTGRVNYSPEWQRLWGYDSGETRDDIHAWEARLHPEDLERVKRLVSQAFADGRPELEFEYRLRHQDGSTRWVLARGRVERNNEGRAIQVTGSHVEITSTKRQGALADRLNRALLLLSESNQALIRLNSETELLQQVCRIAVETGGYRMAWVGFKQNDERKSVQPVAWAGFAPGYLESAQFTWGEDENGRGPTGTAIRTGQPSIGRDLAATPDFEHWRKAAAQYGFRSSISLPVSVPEGILGALTIYSTDVDAFDAAEGEILWKLATDLGFGIRVERDRAEKARSEARLRREVDRNRALIELFKQSPHLTEEQLYGFILDRTIALTESEYGFFHLVSEDQQDVILTTWSESVREQCAVEYKTHYPLAKAGNWVDCVRFKRPVVYNDFAHAPNRRGQPEGHVPTRRVMTVPVEENGKVRCIFGVANKPDPYDDLDVMQIQLVAEELQNILHQRHTDETATLFRTLADHANDGIHVVDPETGRILDANDTACRLHGYTREEYLGLHVAEVELIFDGITPPAWLSHVARLRETGSMMLEGRHRRRDGSSFPAEISRRYIRLNHDYIVTVVRDVSERRQLEEQYRQAQKMEAVGQLAGGIAHDFNNTLAVIQLQSALLLGRAEENSTLAAGLEQIQAATERAAGLTRRLLTFSRQSVLQSKDLDLGEVIGSITRLFRQVLGENICIETRFAPNLPLVHADLGMIEQLLMNLTVNARDAMPKGGSLTFTLEAVEVDRDQAARHPGASAGNFVCLAVTDTGCGIASQDLSHIFEPFFTTKELGKGTGLGLAVVSTIVEQHHGWMEVESEVGHGTRFRIFLPACTTAAPAVSDEKNRNTATGGNETILLVEDEESVRAVTQATLEYFGYRVLTADSPRSALQIWRQQTELPDLLMTDLIMPGGISGSELAEQLIALQPRLKVVYASGYSDEITSSQLRLESGRAFLQKPYTAASLAATVRRCLDAGMEETPPLTAAKAAARDS